jgi:tRNA A37 threonylcarbamoyladenosine dehydratase
MVHVRFSLTRGFLTLNFLSGVSRIRLIDFDLVSLSSLNRHAVATLADVGTAKVTATKKFFAKVAPWAEVDARIELWNDSPRGHQLLNDADWVIGQCALPPPVPSSLLFP